MLTLNEKKQNYKIVNRVCAKDDKIYLYALKKRFVLGVFRIEDVRDTDK